MNDALEALTGLRLLDPWWLLLALLVPLAAALRRRRGPSSIAMVSAPLLFAAPAGAASSAAGLPRSWRVRTRTLPALLQAVGLLLVVVALARPVHRVPMPHVTEGIDIFLCLDVSSSMAARDMEAERTRLDVARAAAAAFIAGRADDRIGLLRFARFPDIVCPPTTDHAALVQLLDGVSMVASDSAEDVTGIGAAVARAAQALGRSPSESRVVILLTDGEENVATPDTPGEITPLQAAQVCRELGVRVYTIVAGVGRRAGDGDWVELDTRQVRHTAESTGGRFFTARDAGAIAAVYANIDELERSASEEPRFAIAERFLLFLAAGFVLIASGCVAADATLLGVLP